MSPIALVAREVSSHGSMEEGDVAAALKRLLWRAMEEASEAMRSDPLSIYALERAEEYQALSEAIVVFGSTLAALNDMEEYDLSRTDTNKAGVS